MKTDYGKLDAAILGHIKNGGNANPMYVKSCYEIAVLVDHAKPDRVIDRRLQALRKAGKIKYVGKRIAGKGHGWILTTTTPEDSTP